MKKVIAVIFSLIMLVISAASFAEDGVEKAVTADMLNDGTYSVTVESSSSMFRVTDCALTVTDGEMTAVMTLSGTGYEKLFMGTGEDALTASEDDYIYFAEDSEGKYTYTVPVPALDTDIDCAAWSIRKQQWYDRTLVFDADSLPQDAYKKASTALPYVLSAIAVCAAFIAIFVKSKRKSAV